MHLKIKTKLNKNPKQRERNKKCTWWRVRVLSSSGFTPPQIELSSAVGKFCNRIFDFGTLVAKFGCPTVMVGINFSFFFGAGMNVTESENNELSVTKLTRRGDVNILSVFLQYNWSIYTTQLPINEILLCTNSFHKIISIHKHLSFTTITPLYLGLLTRFDFQLLDFLR